MQFSLYLLLYNTKEITRVRNSHVDVRVIVYKDWKVSLFIDVDSLRYMFFRIDLMGFVFDYKVEPFEHYQVEMENMNNLPSFIVSAKKTLQ